MVAKGYRAEPLCAWYHVGGWPSVQAAIGAKATYRGLVPTTSWKTALEALLLFSGWGLGYFGMPHVLTKFMGIEHVEELSKSKWVGISWQSLSLLGSTFIGLIGIALFTHLTDDQLVFVNMVTLLFSPFTAAFILCAILGATITAMDSQILVLASNVTEDLYKKVFRKGASSDELILVSRLAIFCIACIAGLIAATTANTIFKIVSYAWFGLGSTFGPLILFSLYYKPTTRGAAISGILIGAFVAGFWPLTDNILPISIPSIIPGFFLSSFTIWLVSFISHRKRGVINEQT